MATRPCPTCGGERFVPADDFDPEDPASNDIVECPTCRGLGDIEDEE